MTSNELLGAVLGLPPKERARIAHELLLSLDDRQGDHRDEHEFIAELDRRRQQVESGEARMLDRAEFARAIASRRATRR
ncbi:addiction module protein [Paraliomyxa miuraensis]|uniref:addiction module protein n=1 Tax=Paraliomyxa miuraensis TaxID=376150 RepID=UPI00225588C5|nr:addiction module protein [Paraliomyxa miuraensis]MCX4246060.1 addiction module protein [Paraliomyxa miuraensis]